ncbi:similar to Saccharomyces cerevisiae YOR265W RBL2 Protein involved in microtubule morphogenesis, required for protection from excess free beta-tubulin [Maudiozyma saulgeensis]|uniref:Tubulin-specific chaperone A n=1 Tax=Maudiozyma saulgeensis TaxID=1789683 RepID=A0A1X7R4F3_9SACH|nr:similar to Saccharomyces cerevisiae YOR265W RBL2 Protein involved in microtubule morphogenesis, required for protection from excess free beta-tubulin [Kazachstania saulgeensis]
MAPTQLEIKVKALERLVKEESYYQQEAKDQAAHVENLKNDPKIDPYDLKKQVEVLEDTQRLLPTLYQKIREFKDDLSQFLASYKGIEKTEPATAALESAETLLATVEQK